LPLFDTSLLMAGEKSGRLDACFRLLSDYYTDRARVARQVIADLLYPVFLFHFFIFIYSFLLWIGNRNWLGFLLGVLIPLYVAVFLLIYAGQSQHGEKWRAFVERIMHPLPVLGSGRRYLALARLSVALEALINAGVTIIEAWQLAAAASGSPALRRTVLAWKPLLNAGQTPADVINDSPTFPELFANQYATGEVSGKLDETLRRLHRYYQEEGTRRLHLVSRWVPIFLYLIVAAIIATFIIRFYMGYFQQIQKIGGF
ncbi:MAG TPA: type II secretion system F family protein, partial [Verrucomicrobiae bacterium]|nr:type II secretion system F family protein [Verrucomicrobiae bacterium]